MTKRKTRKPVVAWAVVTNAQQAEAERGLAAAQSEVLELKAALAVAQRENADWKIAASMEPERMAEVRGLAMEEAARMADGFGIGDSPVRQHMQLLADQLRLSAPLPASLVVVKRCNICGSTDAVLTERANLCSRGHFSDPVRLPATLVAVEKASREEVAALLAEMLTELGEDKYITDRGRLNEYGDTAFRAALSLLEPVKVKP